MEEQTLLPEMYPFLKLKQVPLLLQQHSTARPATDFAVPTRALRSSVEGHHQLLISTI
jgi:hypothetical protein